MDKEVRTFGAVDCELRAARRGRMIDGVGIVFNRLSNDLGGFREIIMPESVDGVLENSDILGLINHDESRGVLARYTMGEGSMDVQKTNNGVKYIFEAPDTNLGEEALSGVRRGDIRASSFAFTVAEGGDRWDKQTDGTYIRTITKFDKIYDFSLVYRPAYSDTSVAVRSLIDIRTKDAEKIAAEAIKKATDLEEELRLAKSPSNSTDVVEQKPEDLTDYFKELRNKIKAK